MSEGIRQIAISITSKVFEKMFFIFLTPRDKGASEEPECFKGSGAILKGEIGFKGKYKGKLRVYFPSEMARLMACNFMGLEEKEISESQTNDLVKELCNILCGNLVCELDQKAIWNLTLPRSSSISLQEMVEDNRGPGTTVDFNAEGQGIRLTVQVENGGLKT